MIEQLTTGVVLLDTNRAVVTMNAAAEQIFGVARAHIRGKSLQRFFQQPQDFHELLIRCQQQDDRFAEELELTQTNGLGTNLLLDCRVARQPDGDGLLLEVTDVTSRRRINKHQRLRTQREIARKITRQMAHEIKNPLGGLRGAAQLLQRQLADSDQKAYTDVIIREADRLASLVDELLGPGGTSKKMLVNIHDVLEHVLQITMPDTDALLEWRRDYDPSLPSINVDRDQIVQAVLNIVRNAIAAIKSHADGYGTITIRTRALINDNIGGKPIRLIASIEIIDTGPGIDPDLQESLFYPLVTSKADGTGIGLSISQELINRHDGLIEFASEPGYTNFQIRLPVDYE
ncbi:MAG: nitrogen regulation protein NR(II) [Pseudomonadota bacterium]